MTICNALRRARLAKRPERGARDSSSGYTPKLGIRGKYIPGTSAPLEIPQVDLPPPGQLPQLGRPSTLRLPPSPEASTSLDQSSAIEVARPLSPLVTDAVTRPGRTQAVRAGVLAAYKKHGSVPLVPLPHQDFVPPYLRQKQRWQRAAVTFSWWVCGGVLFWGVMFSQLDKERSILHPIRAWFAPTWERWWTLTPYDRQVLGLPADGTTERVELQSLKEMAHRAPQESDAYWQTMRFADVMGSKGNRGRDFSRDMPPRPADRPK